MSTLADGVRAEIGSLEVDFESSAVAAAALGLACRLDAGPGDRTAVALTHELRMALADLYARSDRSGDDDVEQFLERMADPTFRGPGH